MQQQAGSERGDMCCEWAPSRASTAEVTTEADPHRRPYQSVLHNLLKVLSPFLWLIYLKIRNSWTIAVIVVFLWNWDKNKTKINHPVVCKTRKHQLKTILCIIYYFMLGWNLGACANSLYKLRLAGSVLGKVCGSVFRRVGVAVRGHGGSRDAFVSASSCPLWEMKTKKQCRLVCVLQSFLVGVCDGAGGGMNP